MRNQAQVDSTLDDEGYSSNDEDTSTIITTDDIQSSPYQILFVLQVRESLLMTAMEVIDLEMYKLRLHMDKSVNEWVEMYRHHTKQSKW